MLVWFGLMSGVWCLVLVERVGVSHVAVLGVPFRIEKAPWEFVCCHFRRLRSYGLHT